MKVSELNVSWKYIPDILIVDDIPGNLNFISNVLSNEGIGITAATTGKDAIDIARERAPDLILLDIAMPVLDGFEVCRILKDDPVTKDIPIIFLTARDEQDDIIKGFEAGAVDFISKPFNTTELLSRVNTHLELRNKTKQLKEINQLLEEKVWERTVQLEESNLNLKNANKELAEAYEKLAKLDRAKNDFVRHINHELRTPLQGIHGFAKILEEIADSDEQKEYIRSINLLVKRLVKLAELSLLFTELKTENYKLELIPVDVSQCINEAVDGLEFREKNISLVTKNVKKDLFILADSKLVSACINIIVDNAIKFSPEHSQITIEAFRKDENVMIDISDKGPGFTVKAREQLFELFSTDNLNDEFHGFGVGLATAKIILDLLSSSMEVTRIPKGGSKVRLILPSGK